MIQVLLFNSSSITRVKQRSFMKYYSTIREKITVWKLLALRKENLRKFKSVAQYVYNAE
jgi:hypothetical protein